MSETPTVDSADANYAMGVADRSYEWYRRAAMKARRYHRLTETTQLLISAAIPVTAAVEPQDAKIPAILGGLVVIITGLRSAFHWHDDYLRFSEAREAVEAERRLYLTRSDPYDEIRRDQVLVSNITSIEQQEMGRWKKIARPRSKSGESE